MDNELRTSFTLFAEESITQDVVDGVSMNINDNNRSPDASMRLAPPLHSPRQSRSCPCSPKLAGRNHSPKSNTGSPKPQSRSGSSKFSLSSSLMAIHRQASNSLRPDFLRFDSGKGDFGGSSSKNGSQQNSLRNESRHSRPSVEAHHNSFGDTQLDSSNSGSLRGESSKHALHESHSLPTLKLSRMSMTYKGGVIVNQDKDAAQFHYSDTTKLLVEGACALPSTPEDDIVSEELTGPSMLLPDVVPRYEVGGSPLNRITESEPSASSAPASPKELCVSYHYRPKEGIVNLGFDGHEETSDFTDFNESVGAKVFDTENIPTVQRSRRGSIDSDIDIGKNNIQMNIESVHAISIGHVPHGQDVAISLDVPQIVTQEPSQAGGYFYTLHSASTLGILKKVFFLN